MSSDVETYILVEGEEMPADLQPPQSELQGAFRRAPGPAPGIVIDMVAALPIARDLVRQGRGAAFEANDAATMMAMQRGNANALADCRAKGDQLRGAPDDPRLAAASTPAALLAAVETIIAEF